MEDGYRFPGIVPEQTEMDTCGFLWMSELKAQHDAADDTTLIVLAQQVPWSGGTTVACPAFPVPTRVFPELTVGHIPCLRFL